MNAKTIMISATAIIVIAVGVYVMMNLDGNSKQELIASGGSQDSAATCKQSHARGKELAEKALGEVAAFRALEDPLDLKSISFLDADGNAKTLADWQGKTVLFNLWATWCAPCREEMPWFDELQAKLGGETFQVVPVSIDIGDISKPKRFYGETGIKNLPLLHDNTMEAFQTLKEKAVALGMPSTLLMDSNGCGLGVLNGAAHWASPDAFNLIEAAISQDADG